MSKGMFERAKDAIKKQKKRKKDRLDEIMSNGPVPDVKQRVQGEDRRDDGSKKKDEY